MNKLSIILTVIFIISGCNQITSEIPTTTNILSTHISTYKLRISPSISFASTITPTMPLFMPTPMIKDPYGHYLEWGEIPIIPGAKLGELEGKKYTFEINSKPIEVKTYYEEVLINLNWTFVRLDPKPNSTSDPANLLIFQFIGWDHQLLTFSVIYLNETSFTEVKFGTYGSYY